MGKLKFKIDIETVTKVLFYLTIITYNTFNLDLSMYSISKYSMLLFFVAYLLHVFVNGKVTVTRSMLLPTVFFGLETAAVLWTSYKDAHTEQWVTQMQLYILFVICYLYAYDIGDINDYLKASYVSGFSLMAYALFRYGISGYISMMQSGVRMGREVSNENTFGLVFSTAALVAFYYLLENGKPYHLFSIGLFTFFTLSSGSKKATLFIIGGFVGLSILHFGLQKIWKLLLILIVIGVAGFFVLQLPLFSTINERLTSFLTGDFNTSDQARQKFIQDGIALIKARPLLGYGLRNYQIVSGNGYYSHNNFIEVATGVGLIGLVIYYIPYCRVLFRFGLQVLQKNKLCTLLFIRMAIEVVFGYGMVQFYGKGSWILLAVMLAYLDKKLYDRGTANAVTEKNTAKGNQGNRLFWSAESDAR